MTSNTIPAPLFAEAIKELPLPTIYAKVSELRNSISHLHRSNSELRAFVAESCDNDDDKRELEGYIAENEVVVVSMNERVALLRAEVEGRGQRWIEEGGEVVVEGEASGNQTAEGPVNGTNGNSGDAGADEEEGVHL